MTGNSDSMDGEIIHAVRKKVLHDLLISIVGENLLIARIEVNLLLDLCNNASLEN